MNAPKFKKGCKFAIVKTLGREKGNYDLYNIEGLTLGKLDTIRNALESYDGILAREILAVINQNRDYQQTIEGI